MRQSAESLAGRVSFVELTPFLAEEVVSDLLGLQQLWLRGGFPLSWLASSDEASMQWRQDFIRTFLLTDLAQMGVRIPAEALRRFWTMLAHLQGALFNASQLGHSLVLIQTNRLLLTDLFHQVLELTLFFVPISLRSQCIIGFLCHYLPYLHPLPPQYLFNASVSHPHHVMPS